MLILSAGAVRVVSAAVDRLSDQQQRADWLTWLSSYPNMRAKKSTYSDNGPNIPAHIVAISLLALELAYSEITKERESADEDDQFYFDNDLTFISSIKKSLLAEVS